MVSERCQKTTPRFDEATIRPILSTAGRANTGPGNPDAGRRPLSESKFDFSGRVVIVTGANGNLGSAVARAYAEAGAYLVLVGRRQERVAEALPELAGRDTVWLAPSTDLTDEAAVTTVVAQARGRFDRLDVLANTVGGYRGGTPVHKMDAASWDFMMSLNARSAFVVSKAVIPTMIEQGYGKIVHTASRAAEAGSRNAAAYAAAKAAVLRLTDSLALELKRKGINVNCVMPGTIDTPDNRSAMPTAGHSRWVAPESIARVFLFLSSDAAQALHGVHIPAYGLS
jgi:NAD(P)-dependent dehydrogenase (short-subunit alcohol dehydrogenase family)